jgi:hypothetical protein
MDYIWCGVNMIAVLHQVFFMTYLPVQEEEEILEGDFDAAITVSFQFLNQAYSSEEYVVFDFSE